MLYPNVPFEEWAKRYDLHVVTETCRKCKLVFTTTIPYAYKSKRGLMAPLHECGRDYQLRTHIDACPKKRKEWARTVSQYINLVKGATND
jgi:hypothetical protein